MREITTSAISALTTEEVYEVTQSWLSYSKADDYYEARKNLVSIVGEENFLADKCFLSLREQELSGLKSVAVGSASAWADLALRNRDELDSKDFEVLTRAWSVLT